MADISQLVQKARRNDSAGNNAVAALIELGAPAVEPLVDGIRSSRSDLASTRLSSVIERLHGSGVVPHLAAHLDDKDMNIVMPSFRALGKSKSAAAVQVLLDYAKAPGKRETNRLLAAEALGDLADRTAIPVLLGVVDQAMKNDELKLAIAAVVALAKLGNHEKASVAIKLTHYEEDPIVRTRATTALQYAVGKGEFASLKRALEDEYFEVRRAAIDAVFYLGLPESVDALLNRVSDDDNSVSNNARVRINDLLGENYSTDVAEEELQPAWKKMRKNFHHGISYRLGRPIWVHDLVDLLAEPIQRSRVLAELRIITGVRFDADRGHADDDHVETRVKQWLQRNNKQYEEGKLYKYGFEQDVTIVGPA